MKKDNSTLKFKASLRRKALVQLGQPPRIIETHGGIGGLFNACYSSVRSGVVFEKDPKKCDVLAAQRPTWSVYECDCMVGLEAGAGFHHNPNFIDIDPYGQPWPVIDAIMPHLVSPKIIIVVNDGLRNKLRIGGAWNCHSMRSVMSMGNKAVFEKYKDVCKILINEKAHRAGYKLTRWTSYYCGANNDMTHYAAVLER